jgi:hypothetical protein
MSGKREWQKYKWQYITAEITEKHHGAAETERATPNSSTNYSLLDGSQKADDYSQAESLHTANDYS